MPRITRNYEHNGLEIYFDYMPSEEIREALKNNHWRWHKYKKCWYNKYSERNYAFARQITKPEPVTNITTYRKTKKKTNWRYGSIDNWNTESKLHSLGYTVARSAGLSERVRRGLLVDIIDKGLMDAEQVIFQLEMNIESHKDDYRFEDANYFWRRDLAFVKSYVASLEKISRMA